MRLSLLVIVGLVHQALSQSITLSGTGATAATSTAADYVTSGVTYIDDSSTLSITSTGDYGSITDLSSAIASANGTMSANATATGNSTSATQTLLVGSARTTTALNGTAAGNSTASATSSAAQPSNTVPCNGFPEFCARKYSNITHVAAHNSPFVRPGNLAANQMLDVETQLNDGIRMRKSSLKLWCSERH